MMTNLKNGQGHTHKARTQSLGEGAARGNQTSGEDRWAAYALPSRENQAEPSKAFVHYITPITTMYTFTL